MPEKTDCSPDMDTDTDRDTRNKIDALLAKLHAVLAQARELVARLKNSFTTHPNPPMEPPNGAHSRAMEPAPSLRRGEPQDDPPSEALTEEREPPAVAHSRGMEPAPPLGRGAPQDDPPGETLPEEDPNADLDELAEEIAGGVAEVMQPAPEAEEPAEETAETTPDPNLVVIETETVVLVDEPLIVTTPPLSIDESSVKFHMLGAIENSRKTTVDKVRDFKRQGRDLMLEADFRQKDQEQKAVFTRYTTDLLDDKIPVEFRDVELVRKLNHKIQAEPDADRFVDRVDKLTSHIKQQIPVA